MNLLTSDSEWTVWKDSVVVDFLIISCLLNSSDCTAVHPCPDPIHVLYSEARPSILVLLSYSTVLILTDLLSSLWTPKSLWLQTCSVRSFSADVPHNTSPLQLSTQVTKSQCAQSSFFLTEFLMTCLVSFIFSLVTIDLVKPICIILAKSNLTVKQF